jgi:hypothetical protein
MCIGGGGYRLNLIFEMGTIAMSKAFPVSAHQLTRERLTELVQTIDPSAEVERFEVTAAKYHEDGSNEVSTAGRIELNLQVAGRPNEKVVVKIARPDIFAQAIYRNEVAFYTRIRPLLDIETPRAIGGEFDEASGTFGLALEDLRVRGVAFPTVKTAVSVAQVRTILDTLANLHARFWQSEELLGELSFVEPHISGDLYKLFHDPGLVPWLINSECRNEQFKREMLAACDLSADQLYHDYRKLQFHQATLPFTLCHGDTHVGNTYLTPDGRGGLLDWQLMARGYFMHDLSYIIITGLDVATRRANDRSLIEYYLKQLRDNGVTNVPDVETAWLEFRRAATWCLYIGWLTTPVENYGWDINVCNHVRLFTAYMDLDSKAALAPIPDVPAYA